MGRLDLPRPGVDAAGPAGVSRSKHSNRYIHVDIPLPVDYEDVYGDNRWWKVRDNLLPATPTDRTTWSANIIGNFVHLLEEHPNGDGVPAPARPASEHRVRPSGSP